VRRSRAHKDSKRARGAALIGITGILAALLSASTDSAVAASTGYTASLIPTAEPGTWTAVDSATDTIYVGSRTTLDVINGATRSVTTTVSLLGYVTGLAVDATTNKVYVSDTNVNTSAAGVYVINGATNTVAATIAEPAAGGQVSGIAVDSTTNTVYVANPNQAELTVINGATNAITTTVSTGAGTRPVGVAVDESSDVVWVADADGTVIAVNGATDTVSNAVSLPGGEPVSVAVNEATDTVYAADLRNADVAVIDGKTATLTTLVAVGSNVFGVAVDQSTGVLYASSNGAPLGTTWVIDGTTDRVTNTIARGSVSVAVDQSTGTVYEASPRTASVWVISASTANALSPVITSLPNGGFDAGIPGKLTVVANALPMASFTESGALPTGVTLSTSGVLAGTPAAGSGGPYPITITASNGVAPDYVQQFSVIVFQAPAITSGDSATFQVGTAGSFSLTATGYTAPAFTDTGTLPAGLSITDQTPGGWEISGTPAVGAGGVYPLTIIAYNGVAPEAEQAFTLTVKEAPDFKSSAQATFVAGTSGNFQVSANGYPAPTFTEAGALPGGLSLSSAGLLAGTPAAGSGGVYPIAIMASNGISPSANQAFTLTVNQAPAITSARSATFKAGHFRRFIFRTSGFPAATLSERGRLPAGVRFRARADGTAVLAGRATKADRGKTFRITITASNSVGAAAHQIFRLKIS
jgi:DNA-binding beta-propeller fold protein YncE